MFLKIMGAILIFLACSAFGLSLSGDYDKRIKSLSNIKKSLMLLKGEIKYSNSGISESLKRVLNKTDSQIGKMFEMVYEKLKNGSESLNIIWNDSVEQCLRCDLGLKEKDLINMKDLGVNLGITDRDTQMNNITMCIENIDSTLDELQNKRNEKCKLYRTLGMMSGAFIAIVLM